MRSIVFLSLLSLSFCSQLESYNQYLVFAAKNHLKSVSQYAETLGVTDLDSQWERFKADFDRNFATAEEEEPRKFNFLRNIQSIESHNKLFQKGDVSHELAVNQFSDWSSSEYESFLSLTPAINYTAVPNLVVAAPDPSTFAALPESFDWRSQSKVTPIKNQGSCGSCWAFAAVATIESAMAIHHDQVVSLSEQQLVDCDRSNQACTVGNVGNAMDYVQQNGLESETDYPYVSRVESCMNNAQKSHLKIKGHVMLPHMATDEQIMSAIYNYGPVAVNIDASGNDFQQYKSGILSTGNKQMNHYVVAIGWAPGYWIVKNSWGTSWGEAGFGQMARGIDVRGFNSWLFYPQV